MDLSRKQKRNANKRNIRVVQGDTVDPAWLEAITELLETGTVTPRFDTVLPFTDVRAAQELSEAGHARDEIIRQVRDGVAN